MKMLKKTMSVILCLVTLFCVASIDCEGFVSFAESTNLATSENDNVCLADLECVSEGHYTGNLGDSRVYKLDATEFAGISPKGDNNCTYRNGNIGVNGAPYSNGFEIWIARWNYGDNISWAFRTFKLDGKYKTLSGKSGLIKSYNTSDFDDTVYFYDGNTLLHSFSLTPNNYEQSFLLNVDGVKELKVLVKDNKNKAGGTSFALYDLFLDCIQIPNDATAFNGHYYKIYDRAISWTQAKVFCENIGGHLATITSQTEQNFIDKLNINSMRLWIGGHRESVDNWKWVTGELWDYTNWDEGEPNNSSNVVSNENSVSIWPSKWNDLNENNLSEQSGFVCEWDSSSIINEDEVFYEKSYMASILLDMHGSETPAVTKTLNDILDNDSMSAKLYDDLKNDTKLLGFRNALTCWQGMKCVFDPTTGLEDLVLDMDDLYEGLIFDFIKNVAKDENQYIGSLLTDAQEAAIEDIGEVKKDITKYYKTTKDLNNAVKYTEQSFALAQHTWKTTGNLPNNLSVYIQSDQFKNVTKLSNKWYGKAFKAFGTILDAASDVDDFYNRINLYIMASEMSEEMVSLLQEMYRQTSDMSFRTALSNVMSSFENVDYAATICTLDLALNLELDVLSPLIDEVIMTTPFGVYYFAWQLSYKASTAFCNMMFNTGSVIDKYYLCGATKEFSNCMKRTINSLGAEYKVSGNDSDAAAYVYAIKVYKWVYYADIGSLCEFVKAGSEEGLINLSKKLGNWINKLITGQDTESDYESILKSKESIMQSLTMRFDYILSDWIYNVDFLKTDYPDLYPIYVKKELSADLYKPHISSAKLNTNGKTELSWDSLCYYVDNNGYYRILPASHYLAGFEAIENVAGFQTTQQIPYSENSSVAFYNKNSFSVFPKTYAVRGYTDEYYTGSREYTQAAIKDVLSPCDFDLQFYNGCLGIVDYADSSLADITTYEIYRKTNNSSYTKIQTLKRNTSILDLFVSIGLGKTAGLCLFFDNNTTPSTTYTYKAVKKITFTNGKSLISESNEIFWKHDDNTKVLDLFISQKTATQKKSIGNNTSKKNSIQSNSDLNGVCISWDILDNAVGYEIFRQCSYGTVYRKMASVNAFTTSYIDRNIENGVDYNYKVYPIYKNADGNFIYTDTCYFDGKYSGSNSFIKIHNYVPLRTEDYRTTITFSIDDIVNPVSGAEVYWFINETIVGTGNTYTEKEAKQSYTVQAKYMKDGQILAESETEKININTGFFAKFKAFLRALFGRLPVLTQEWLGVEIIDRVLSY